MRKYSKFDFVVEDFSDWYYRNVLRFKNYGRHEWQIRSFDGVISYKGKNPHLGFKAFKKLSKNHHGYLEFIVVRY